MYRYEECQNMRKEPHNNRQNILQTLYITFYIDNLNGIYFVYVW